MIGNNCSTADEDRATRRVSYLKATWGERMHVDSDLELSDSEPVHIHRRYIISRHARLESDISRCDVRACGCQSHGYLFVSSRTHISIRYYRWHTFISLRLSLAFARENNEHSIRQFRCRRCLRGCKYNCNETAPVFVSMFPVRIDDGGRRYFRATLRLCDASLRIWRRPRPYIETLIIGEGERVPFAKSTGIRMHCLYTLRVFSSKLMYIRSSFLYIYVCYLSACKWRRVTNYRGAMMIEKHESCIAFRVSSLD